MNRGKAPSISADQVTNILNAQYGANVIRDRAILGVSFFMGLRAKEIAYLNVGDVFDGKSVRQVVRLFKTKGDKFREIPIHPKLSVLIHQHLSIRGTRLDASLFLSQKGMAFNPNTMQRLVAHCYKKAGIDASSHSGRRSFANFLLDSGVDIYTIQVLMGHSSITTTQRYLETSTSKMTAAINRITI